MLIDADELVNIVIVVGAVWLTAMVVLGAVFLTRFVFRLARGR